jgi:hypothetical protein
MDEIEAFCNVRCRPLLSKLGRSPCPDSQACTCPIVPHAIGQPASAVPLLARAGAAGRLPLEQRPVAWVADRRGSVTPSSAITGLIVLTPPCHRCVFLLPCPALPCRLLPPRTLPSGRQDDGRAVERCPHARPHRLWPHDAPLLGPDLVPPDLGPGRGLALCAVQGWRARSVARLSV